MSNCWSAALTLEQAIDRKFLTIIPNTPVTEAIATLNQAQTSYILVVEQQRLVGIFTERDVVIGLWTKENMFASIIRELKGIN